MPRTSSNMSVAMLVLLSLCGDVAWAAKRTVVVLRHTFRAPDSTLKCTPNRSVTTSAGEVLTFEHWNNFSQRPWPDFGTAPKNATIRGLNLTTEFAQKLPQKLDTINAFVGDNRPTGSQTGRVQFVYDDNDRDRETSQALADGFSLAGIFGVVQSANESLYDPEGQNVCARLSAVNRTQDVLKQKDTVPVPANYQQGIEAMKQVMGSASSGYDFTDPLFSDYIYQGYREGQSCLAASFAESFLFEYGSRILVGWGGVDLDPNTASPNGLFRLLENHVYYRSVNMKGVEVSRHSRSNLANAMLRVLDGGDGSPNQNPDDDVLTVFVGHDADVDQISTLFGITFQLPPDNQNAVPPMSGLVLTMDSASTQLKAQYIGALWDPQNMTHLVLEDIGVEDAFFVNSNEQLYQPIGELKNDATVVSQMDYRTVRSNVFSQLNADCVENLVSDSYVVPLTGWVLAVCIGAAAVVVGVLIAVVWRMKQKSSSAPQPLMTRAVTQEL